MIKHNNHIYSASKNNNKNNVHEMTFVLFGIKLNIC